jgi:UDP-N-acetyl-D-mannosaminuronate dehydrogenase
VGDVRETPVTELQNCLINQGAEVAWFDPLVESWEGSKPVDLDWECDLAVLATKQPGMEVSHLISRGVQILDCTNTMKGLAGVISL